MTDLYKPLVRSVIIHDYPIPLTSNGKIWNRLQITQNEATRASPRFPPYTSLTYIHEISNISTIKEYAISLLKRSITQAKNSNDNISIEILSHTLNKFNQN